MNKEKIKESISQILDVGGSVSFSYKMSLESWVATVSIQYFDGYYSDPCYTIHDGPAHGEYKTKEEAIDKFVDSVFNENNLAMVFEGIKKRLNVQDLEAEGFDCERPSEEFLKLIEDEKKSIKELSDLFKLKI